MAPEQERATCHSLRKDVFIRISFMVIPWKPGDSDLERSQGCTQDSFPTLMRCSSSALDGQCACLFVCNLSMCVCIHFFVCVCVYVCYNYPRGLRWYGGQPLLSLSHPSHSWRAAETGAQLSRRGAKTWKYRHPRPLSIKMMKTTRLHCNQIQQTGIDVTGSQTSGFYD